MVSQKPIDRVEDSYAHPARRSNESGIRCPWCDQSIPTDRLVETSSRIMSREARIREEAERTAAANAERRFAESEEIRTVQFGALRLQLDEARQAVSAASSQGQEKLQELERAKHAAEEKLRELSAAQERELQQRLKEQRIALENDRTAAIQTERNKMFEEGQKLQARIQDLQKQVDGRTGNALDEGAHLNIFELLTREFPHDRITQVHKSTTHVNILHAIIHNGKLCGRILYDTNPRTTWRNEYVAKLREEQIAAQADHALLISGIFPAGVRQLHVQDHVIVVNPARVAVLVQVLRRHVVQGHGLRLSNEAREHKTVKLYEFITSERSTQLFERIRQLSDDMLDLDVKEKRAHDINWRRRGELIRCVQRAQGDFSAEVERIIGAAAAARS